MIPLKDVKISRGNFVFKGKFIKNGLDSSRIINLIITSSSKDYQIMGHPFPPNLFYVHKLSINETIGILINKHHFDKNDAKEKVKKWITELQIKVIDPLDIDGYENIVNEANNQVIKEFGDGYNIGDIDKRIIASFIKEGINVVHVKDKGFEETCKRLKLNVIETPERDFKLEKKLKKRINK